MPTDREHPIMAPWAGRWAKAQRGHLYHVLKVNTDKSKSRHGYIALCGFAPFHQWVTVERSLPRSGVACESCELQLSTHGRRN